MARKARKDFAITTPEDVALHSPEKINAPAKARIKLDLTDARIEARQDFMPDGCSLVILQDHGGTRSVRGLQMHIGPRSATWIFYRDVNEYGKRVVTSKKIGSSPAMTTEDARTRAEVLAGAYAGGRRDPGPTTALKFGAAFASYVEYLKIKAEDAGKPPTWATEVARLGNKIMLPKWANWPLLDMSKRRAPDVADWYATVVKNHGVTSAAHCVRIIRAVYMRAAKRDDSLPGDATKVPTAAIQMRREKWQKRTGPDKPGVTDFAEWYAAWQKLAPMRRAYHLTNLLTGARPGELARTPWSNFDPHTRTLTIGNAKMGHDIPIPLSGPIAAMLKLARDNKAERTQKKDHDLIFKGCAQATRDELPATGMALRRTFKSIALGHTDDTMSAFLMGHIPEGMSAKYALRMLMLKGHELRGLQAKQSRIIMDLLCRSERKRLAA
jgi:integrase